MDIIPNLNDHYQVASLSNARYEQWTLVSTIIPLMIIFGFAVVISVVSRKVLMRAREIDVIFQASPDAFIYSDSKGNILRSNQMASDIFGYSEFEPKKLKIEDLVEPTKQEHHENLRKAFVKQGGRRMMGGRNTEIKGVTKSGKRIPLSIAISSFSFEEHQGSIAIIRDITDFKRLESDSMHDALTGVYNRRHIEERFEDEVKRAKRYARTLSLLVVDLDNFKNLNDTEGHRAGDKGLVVAAEHLLSQLRKHDHIGRWGGDEFVVICPELDRDDAIEIAERIRRRFEALQFPWHHKVTMSIGITSLSPRQRRNDAARLIRRGGSGALSCQGARKKSRGAFLRFPASQAGEIATLPTCDFLVWCRHGFSIIIEKRGGDVRALNFVFQHKANDQPQRQQGKFGMGVSRGIAFSVFSHDITFHWPQGLLLVYTMDGSSQDPSKRMLTANGIGDRRAAAGRIKAIDATGCHSYTA